MTSFSKYRRFGLRADKSLADLPDSAEALKNVLDDLVIGKTFDGFDLKVIDGLRNTNLYQSDLAELSGQVQTYTPVLNIDGVVVTQNPLPVQPTPTIQNVIDNRKTIFGRPPIFRGGNGPRATLFPGDALKSNSHLVKTSQSGPRGVNNPTLIYDTTNPNIIVTTDYWLDGAFGFSTQIHPEFKDNFGGIQWEGYLGVEANEILGMKTNGLFVVEREFPETLDYDYVPVLSNRGSDRKFVLTQVASNDLTIYGYTTTNGLYGGAAVDRLAGYLPVDQNVFIGDLITINPGTGTETVFEIVGVEHNKEWYGGIGVKLELQVISGPETGITGTVYTGPGTTSSEFDINDMIYGDEKVQQFILPGDILAEKELRKYRITVWWPNPSDVDPLDTRSTYPSKWVSFDFGDETSDNPAPYVYWYSDIPPSAGEKYSFQYFTDNRISNTNEKTSTFVQSTQRFFSTYEPKFKYEDVTRTLTGFNWQGKNRFTWTGTSGNPLVVPQQGDRILMYTFYTTNVNDWQHFIIEEIDFNNNTLWVNQEAIDAPNSGWALKIPRFDNFTAVVYKADGLQGFYLLDTVTGNATQYEVVARPIEGLDTSRFSGFQFAGDNRYALNNIKQDNIVYAAATNGVTGTGENGHRIVEVFETVDGNDNPVAEITLHSIDDAGANTKTFDTLETDGGNFIAVYSHKGLDDSSVAQQCVGVYGKEVKNSPEAASGTTTIAVSSIEGIRAGDLVQFPGIIQNNTKVAVPSGGSVGDLPTTGIYTDPFGQTWHTITIDKPTINTLPNAYTLVFISFDQINNYFTNPSIPTYKDVSYCVLPFNTAPPFLGTPEGLSTSVDYPHLSVGQGGLLFEEFQLETDSVVVTSPENSVYSRYVQVKDSANNTYYLLGTTNANPE